MKKIKAVIRGVSPYLMHKYAPRDENNIVKGEIDYSQEVLRTVYKDEKIGIYIPSTQIKAAMRESAKIFKLRGKQNFKKIIMASVYIEPEKIPLNKNYDEIDSRFVRIQRQGIVRNRARFNSWELKFTISFDEERINITTLKQILIEAGISHGIGDYRPEFGRFEIIDFKE
jgi:hypothetical protein